MLVKTQTFVSYLSYIINKFPIILSTFAPAFRRNRWWEVASCPLCCVGTIQ